MAQKETKVWIYLTRRDKSGVRFLSQFRGKEEVSPTRLKEVANLNLPPANTQKLTEIVYESRLEWEPWIESADSFDNIKDKIKKRGYTNLPISFIPEVRSNNIALTPEVYTSNLNKTKIMTRRQV
jgi:hypothetical protein